MWKAKDGTYHEAEEDAITADLVVDTAALIRKKIDQYDLILSREDAEAIADLIVNTDALADLNLLLRDKL
jgi:hypothetical protein